MTESPLTDTELFHTSPRQGIPSFSGVLAIGLLLVIAGAATPLSADEHEGDPAAIDPGFDTGSGASDGLVLSIDYRTGEGPENTRILLGGDFLSFAGESHSYLTMLDGSGAVVPSPEFSPASIVGPFFPPGGVEVARWDSEGRILIAGLFDSVGGEPRESVARLNADGSLDTSFVPPAVNGRVWDLVVLEDDSVVMVGEFTQVGGQTVNRIAKLNANDGSRDTAFGSSIGFNGNVFAVTLAENGDLLVGGAFTQYRSNPAGRLVRIESDSGDRVDGFSIGQGFGGGDVRALHVSENGQILAGGGFTSFDASPAPRLVKLNAAGVRQGLSIGTGFNNTIHALSFDLEGRILAVGRFTQVNSEPRPRVARLLENGSLDPGFLPGSGPDDFVYDLLVQPDGKLLIGGAFRFYRGQAHRRIARLTGGGEVAEPGDGFDAWRQEMFSGGDASNDAVSGPQADPDGDGLPNLLEYAFSGDPLIAYSAELPEQSLAQETGGEYLEITFHRLNADDLVYRVQATDNLNDSESWTEIWNSVNHPFSGSSETVRDTMAVGNDSARFLRVQVSLQ